MSDRTYNYDYMPLTSTSRRRKFHWVLTSGLGALVILNFIALRWHTYQPANVLDTLRPINSLSPIYEPANPSGKDRFLDIPGPEERAVVTTLYNEKFSDAALALGHSLHEANTTSRRIVLYFPDQVSKQTLCRLQHVGWEPRPIARIAPPNGGRGVHHRFLDQYSKLQLWTLDQIGIKSAIYLDADALVRRNFDELWRLPFEFAAVPDVYDDNRGFTLTFNAGMLFLRTSSNIFNEMLSKIETAHYRRLDAEQGFLNVFFATQAVKLPYIYNANLVIKQRNPAIWSAIEKDIRVVHYTMMKPFLKEQRGTGPNDLWKPELEWWNSVWRNVSQTLPEKCAVEP